MAEIIAIKIRTDSKKKGILVGDSEIKISLMADDTTLFLSDIKSLKYSISSFNKFTICSGLKLNMEKTEIIPLGKLKNKSISLSNDLGRITVNNGPFKTLGIWYSHDQKEVTNLNFTDRLLKMNNLINIWKSRNLSLKGKITIIRSLILPQIQFLFPMVFVPDSLLKDIDNLLFNYLWGNKPAKIKRSTIIAPIEDGGLNMIDVFAVLSLGEQSLAWKKIMYSMLNISSEMLNRNIKHTEFVKCKTTFHEQILNCWNELQNNNSPSKILELLNQNLFYNQLIKINKKHITERYAKINREVCSIKIKDIIDNNGKTLNHEQINNKFQLNFSEWNWMTLMSAIPKTWKDKLAKEPNLPKLKELINTKDTYIIINNTAKNLSLTNSKELYKKMI